MKSINNELFDKINEFKNTTDELDNCMNKNCNKNDVKKLVSINNKCSKKVEKIKSLLKQNEEKQNCYIHNYQKNPKLLQSVNKVIECVGSKCLDKQKKISELSSEFVKHLNPDVIKKDKLNIQRSKLYNQKEECFYKNCDSIFPVTEMKKILEKCEKKISSSKGNYKVKSSIRQNCLNENNYIQKRELKNKCIDEKCKKINEKNDKKLDAINKKIYNINKKTLKLVMQFRKKHNIKDNVL